MYREEHPTAFRAILAGIAVLLVAALVGSIVLLTTGDDDRAAETRTSGGDGGGASTSDSVCDLPAGDDTTPTAGPEASWSRVRAYEVPSSETYGPGVVDDGIQQCFAHNPTGALFAAANLLGIDEEADAVEFAKLRTARGPLYEEFVDSIADNPESYVSSGPLETADMAGFRFLSYDDATARLELVYSVTATSGETGFVAAPVELVWQDGDWKDFVTDLDYSNDGTTPASLAGYNLWDSSGIGEGAGVPESESSGAVGRAAPQWAQAADPSPAPESESSEEECLGRGCIVKGGATGLVKSALAPGLALAGDAAGAAAAEVGDSAFDAIAQQFVEAQNWALKNLMSGWMRLPNPDVSSSESVTVWITDRLEWLTVAVMLGAVIVSGYRMVISGKFEHLSDLAGAMFWVVLTAGAVGTAVPLAIGAGSIFADWIIAQSDTSIYRQGLVLQGMTNSVLLLFSGAFIMLIQFFQLAIMIVRSGAILYLTGVLTLFAAGSTTQVGRQGFHKAVAWLVAFILYEPAAALIYAGAFQMTANRNVITQLTGIFMMVLALLALPALMRLVVPATAALGGSNAGALAGATVGAAVATGAVVATGGMAGAGFAGAGAAGGASGAAGGASGAGMSAAGGGAGGGGMATGAGAAAPAGAGGAPPSSPKGSETPPSGGGPTGSGDAGTPADSQGFSGNDGGTSGGGVPAGSGSTAEGAGSSGIGAGEVFNAMGNVTGAAGRAPDTASGAVEDGNDDGTSEDRR